MSFAVFNMLNDYQMTVVAALNLSSSVLSILGSGSIIVCALTLKKVALAEVFPLFQLSVGDLAATSLLVVSCILELSKINPYLPGHQSACDYIQGITSSFFVTTFLLTMLYAVEACLRLRKRLKNEPFDQKFLSFLSDDTPSLTAVYYAQDLFQKLVSHNAMYFFYFLAWLLPCIVAIVVSSVATTDVEMLNSTQNSSLPCSSCLPVFHYNEDACYVTLVNGSSWHVAEKSLFLFPLLIVIIINIMLYIYINKLVKKMSVQRGYRNRGDEIAVLNKTLQYQIVFVFCWGSSLVLGFASFFKNFNMESFFAVYIIQALLGPLQGFLNCIVYGWRRKNFRRTIAENTPLTSAINKFMERSFNRSTSKTSSILSSEKI